MLVEKTFPSPVIKQASSGKYIVIVHVHYWQNNSLLKIVWLTAQGNSEAKAWQMLEQLSDYYAPTVKL